MPDRDSAAMQVEAYKRLLLIRKQQELGVQISTEAAAGFARRILGQTSLDDFVEKVLKPQGLDAADFDHFLRHELGIQQLIMTAGLSGKLVAPQEAETLYREEHQDLASSMAMFSASNYLAQVAVLPQALSQFYSNGMANYRLPERVQVSYVKFDVTNYLAAARASLTNLDAMVDENVQHMGTNLYHNTKTPEESKAAVREDLLRRAALLDARKAAGEFAEELDQMQPRRAANLAELAGKKGLAVLTTAPFDSENGPLDFNAPASFAQQAFRLTDDDPFTGSIIGEDGVYVLALKQRFPSEIPALKTIEARVTADFRHAQALQPPSRRTPFKFSNSLTNGLAQGKTFAALAAEAGVKPTPLPPFSLSTRTLPPELEDQVSLSQLKQVAFVTPPGKASPPERARDGAFVLHVEKQLPVDEAELKKELPGFLAYMRQSRQNDAFNQWFVRQFNQDPAFAQRVQKLSEETQMRTANARPPRS